MKYIYFVLGLICVALGGIGVVLPILPTAPFFTGGGFLLCPQLGTVLPMAHSYIHVSKAFGTTGNNRPNALKKARLPFWQW